jgi:hypothetical protein
MISELKRRRRNTLKITLCFKLGDVPSKGDKISRLNKNNGVRPAGL